MSKNIKRIEYFGVHIDLLTMDETLCRIDTLIENRMVTQHVVINVAKLVMSQKDKNLRDIINSCGLINADGQGIVWGAKLLGLPIPERVAGIDLMMNLVKRSVGKGYKISLLGATTPVIEMVVKEWQAQYPKLKIVGYRNGYFSEKEEYEIVEKIRNSRPDILMVGMSSPKKEIFLNKYLEYLEVPFVMGVGGSFDVVAGKVKRAPLWMQKAGMEWFYRALNEPERMWRRYLITNSVYLKMIISTLISKGLNL